MSNLLKPQLCNTTIKRGKQEMTTAKELTKYEDIPCCPVLETDPVCDVLDFRRRLVFPTNVRGPAEREQPVRVEVIFHTRFTRCAGPLALGDIAYSTTLLPGEKVRLATTDRRSRFSFDSESKLSYRSEQISEEQYRLCALRAFMADENVVDRGNENYSERRKMQLELERMELENKLLARKIELLDKTQEYRCCPAGETLDA